jgi:HD-GYP domain-containing protein (c-di-GMP phosphodiesterase class II)
MPYSIRKCDKKDIDSRPLSEQKYCLYLKSNGKLLGRHSSNQGAEKQIKAIETNKHGSVKMKNFIKKADMVGEENPKKVEVTEEDLKKVTDQLAQMISLLKPEVQSKIIQDVNKELQNAVSILDKRQGSSKKAEKSELKSKSAEETKKVQKKLTDTRNKLNVQHLKDQIKLVQDYQKKGSVRVSRLARLVERKLIKKIS